MPDLLVRSKPVLQAQPDEGHLAAREQALVAHEVARRGTAPHCKQDWSVATSKQ